MLNLAPQNTHFSFQVLKTTVSLSDSLIAIPKDFSPMDDYEWKKTAITVVLVLAILAGMVYGMIKAI